jgi:hypothetical protein
MGNSLKLIDQNQNKKETKETCKLLDSNIYPFFKHKLKVPLSKLREYHGSFKSICNNFSIDEN